MIPSDPPLLAAGFHGVPDGHVAAIVTALEMTAPPPPRPTRTDDGLVLQKVARPELRWYRALFRRIGSDWLWASRLEWSDEQLAATLHDRHVEIFAALPEGAGAPENAIGLVELDLRYPPNCEIAFFGLVPGFTGKGFGRVMMDFALARAWAAPGVTRVWIHTCTLDDPLALPFYMRSGFRAFTRQVEILPDPRLSGGLPREAAARVPVIEPR